MAHRLLANENFPAKSVLFLESKGYDIMSVGKDCPGITDAEIMEIAIHEQRLILTFDRDYGDLIFRKDYKPTEGVIYLRLENYEPDFPGQLVDSIITTSNIEFTNKLTVVDKQGIRQRKFLTQP